jgi:hypothetical protein
MVLIAPPDHHVLINPDRTISLSQSALVHFVRPSADLLFESAAGSYRDKVIAVILTGSGSDGSMGVKAVKENGGTVIAQDEATSQFFGMPGAAMERPAPSTSRSRSTRSVRPWSNCSQVGRSACDGRAVGRGVRGPAGVHPPNPWFRFHQLQAFHAVATGQ